MEEDRIWKKKKHFRKDNQLKFEYIVATQN